MSNTTQAVSVQFNNQNILTVEQNGIIYTALKPICENIGLDWTAQVQRIKRDEVLNSTMVIITTVAEDGKNREQICLPIQYLNGWLFGIDIKRVNPEIKDTLIMYKKECYQALHDYWNKGVAVNPRLSTTDERLPLRNAVNNLSTKTGIHWKTIWDMVNQYMGTNHVYEISTNDLPKAIEYVHQLTLGHNTKLSDEDAIHLRMWVNIGVHKQSQVRDEIDEAYKHIYDAMDCLAKIQKHNGILHDALVEPKKPKLTHEQYAIADKRAMAFINGE